MIVTECEIAGLRIIEPECFGDERGFFLESFNVRRYAELAGLTESFVQDNHSRSAQGVLRGLHYQLRHPQGKLIRVTHGEIFDVAVDLRRSSPTFGRAQSMILSADNHRQFWIPPGFAHGFLVMSDFADVLYKSTDYWDPDDEHCLAWDDPEIGIAWPLAGARPVLSTRDETGESLRTATPFP